MASLFERFISLDEYVGERSIAMLRERESGAAYGAIAEKFSVAKSRVPEMVREARRHADQWETLCGFSNWRELPAAVLGGFGWWFETCGEFDELSDEEAIKAPSVGPVKLARAREQIARLKAIEAEDGGR